MLFVQILGLPDPERGTRLGWGHQGGLRDGSQVSLLDCLDNMFLSSAGRKQSCAPQDINVRGDFFSSLLFEQLGHDLCV